MRTKPYRTAIGLFDEVELLDVAGPIAVLSSAGRQWNFRPFKIELVSEGARPVSTRSVLTLQATHAMSDHAGAECLFVPGGYGALRAAESADFLRWLQRAAESAEFIVGIGNGVWALAKAGLVVDETIAVSRDLADAIALICPSARPEAVDPQCVSGKLYTTRVSAGALDLSCEIVARCYGKKLASQLSISLGIGWSGELESLQIVQTELVPKL